MEALEVTIDECKERLTCLNYLTFVGLICWLLHMCRRSGWQVG